MNWRILIHRLSIFLLPLSCLYGIGVRIRNRLFDAGMLKEKSFDMPIICVGNLAVGGTGKTPHIEYLVRLLKDKYRVAVVSRGYKRLSTGFVLAEMNHSYADIGDEPFQIKHKYPEIIVAVDANRREAIYKLMNLSSEKRPEVILLDDAFQHRYVKPSYSILLTDYNRLYSKDCLLPAGRLREPRSGARRADMIIVTKSPLSLKPIDYRITEADMQLQAHQLLYFTYIKYGKLIPLFKNTVIPLPDLKKYTVLAISGIASPVSFQEELRKKAKNVHTMEFSDHHGFTEKDICRIKETFQAINAKDKLIVTTEKDAARLAMKRNLGEEIMSHCYYLPIQVAFHQQKNIEFERIICKHIADFYANIKK